MKIKLSLASAFVLLGGFLSVPAKSAEFTMQTAGYCNGSYSDDFSRTTLAPDWKQNIGSAGNTGDYSLSGGKMTQIMGDFDDSYSAVTHSSSASMELESQRMSGNYEVILEVGPFVADTPDYTIGTEIQLVNIPQVTSGTGDVHLSFIAIDDYPTTIQLAKEWRTYNPSNGLFTTSGSKLADLSYSKSTVYKIKIARVGNVVSMYVYNNSTSVFTKYADITANTNDTFIRLNSYTAANAQYDTFNGEISFDNLSITCGVPTPVASEKVVYRFFNKITGSWLYTDSVEEKNAVSLLTNEWSYDGEKFKIIPLNALDITGTIPVYRFFNKCIGGHIFTINETEKNSIKALSCYTYEGDKFRVYDKASAKGVDMYRYFDKVKGYHLFTSSTGEKTQVDTMSKFSFEGVPFKVISL